MCVVQQRKKPKREKVLTDQGTEVCHAEVGEAVGDKALDQNTEGRVALVPAYPAEAKTSWEMKLQGRNSASSSEDG